VRRHDVRAADLANAAVGRKDHNRRQTRLQRPAGGAASVQRSRQSRVR
jgi:hypothetical protein